MSYISKSYRDKIVEYFKDYDYCHRHFMKCVFKPNSVSTEYFMKCQRRYYAMYDLFLKILETL